MNALVLTGKPDDYISILLFRLKCKENKELGQIIEGKEIFPVGRNGYYTRHDKYPSIEEEHERLILSLMQN